MSERIELLQSDDTVTVIIDGSHAGELSLEKNSHGDWWFGDLEFTHHDNVTYGYQVHSARDLREIRGQVQDFIWGNFEDL